MAAFRDQPLPAYLLNSIIVALFPMAVSLFILLSLRMLSRGSISNTAARSLPASSPCRDVPAGHADGAAVRDHAGLTLLNSYWALVLPYTVLEPAHLHAGVDQFSRTSRAIWKTPQ